MGGLLNGWGGDGGLGPLMKGVTCGILKCGHVSYRYISNFNDWEACSRVGLR